MVADQTSAMVARCLTKLIYRHGMLTFLIHDHHDLAPVYLSDILQDTTFIVRIKQLPTSAGHQQFNRLVEWVNCTLKANKEHDWDKLLGALLLSYQTTVHFSTGETPFLLL